MIIMMEQIREFRVPSTVVVSSVVVEQGSASYDEDPQADTGDLVSHIYLVLQLGEEDLREGYVEEDTGS